MHVGKLLYPRTYLWCMPYIPGIAYLNDECVSFDVGHANQTAFSFISQDFPEFFYFKKQLSMLK